MGRHTVQEELAVVFSYFHLLALAVVGEGLCDDCGIVLVDDIVLGVSGGEDDGSAHGDLGLEEGGCGYILVVNQGFVDLVANSICDNLAGDVVSFGMGGGFSRGRSREMASNFAFGLGVPGQNEFGCGGLLSLTLLPQVLPTFSVGGMCGLLCRQMWLDRWCSSGVSVRVCVGPSVGGQAVGVGVFIYVVRARETLPNTDRRRKVEPSRLRRV